jgi:hypothetical protein
VILVRERPSKNLRRAVLSLVAVVACPDSLTVSAHDSFGHFPQHRVALEIGPVSIDLELELTFFPPQSAAACRLWDKNRDGRHEPSELEAYARQLTREAEDRIRISVDGKSVRVTTLFEPEWELPQSQSHGQRSHVLRLFLFGRTPAERGAIEVHHDLFGASPALCSWEAKGRCGTKVTPLGAMSMGTQLYGPGEERIFQMRYRRATAERASQENPTPHQKSRRLHISFDETQPGAKAPQGAAELAEALVRGRSHLFAPERREVLTEIHRQFREAKQDAERGGSEAIGAVAKGEQAARQLLEILNASEAATHFTLVGESPSPAQLGPIVLKGDSGSFLFRVTTGDAEIRCTVTDFDVSTEHGAVEIETAPSGTTWAFVKLRGAPAKRTSLRLVFQIGVDRQVTVPFDITAPEHGRIVLTVLADDTGKAAPAMVRLTSQEDGESRKPAGAIEYASQWNGISSSERRNAILPGRLRGQYWCVPAPFDMTLPPGEWEVIVRRGLEHEVVFDTFTVKTGETVEKTYRPRRWVDMRQRGWFSGDDHVHCQIQSDADARRLMSWVQAEDIHLANVVKMGDIHKTYFEQRGFGKAFRVVDNDYILSPGQECPRTDEIGHTLAMNITSMVRDTDNYFLYDKVFDTVHTQGGLAGYAHVNRNLFHVHRDMSMNIPRGKVDFVELLQFGNLRTDLYYEFLNTGFRMTASAGSDVPWGGTIGEVRMFAYIGSEVFSADAWFDAVRRGRTFVTNGPMLELRVDEAFPGDTVRLAGSRRLDVRVRGWGDARRVLPAKVELVKQGEVIAHAETSGDEEELTIHLKLDGENGFWIAARAEGTDGSKAHTTPIYVVREPLRFWKFDAVEDLITRRLTSLAEIEQIVADAAAQNERGEVDDNRTIQQLALQGPQLLKRVEAAKQLYEDFKRIYETEQTMRAP